MTLARMLRLALLGATICGPAAVLGGCGGSTQGDGSSVVENKEEAKKRETMIEDMYKNKKSEPAPATK